MLTPSDDARGSDVPILHIYMYTLGGDYEDATTTTKTTRGAALATISLSGPIKTMNSDRLGDPPVSSFPRKSSSFHGRDSRSSRHKRTQPRKTSRSFGFDEPPTAGRGCTETCPLHPRERVDAEGLCPKCKVQMIRNAAKKLERRADLLEVEAEKERGARRKSRLSHSVPNRLLDSSLGSSRVFSRSDHDLDKQKGKQRFRIGQVGRPDQMEFVASTEKMLIDIARLREGDGAFVCRSDKVYTWAVLKERETGSSSSLIFYVDERMCTKKVPLAQWATRIRLPATGYREDDDDFDSDIESLISHQSEGDDSDSCSEFSDEESLSEDSVFKNDADFGVSTLALYPMEESNGSILRSSLRSSKFNSSDRPRLSVQFKFDDNVVFPPNCEEMPDSVFSSTSEASRISYDIGEESDDEHEHATPQVRSRHGSHAFESISRKKKEPEGTRSQPNVFEDNGTEGSSETSSKVKSFSQKRSPRTNGVKRWDCPRSGRMKKQNSCPKLGRTNDVKLKNSFLVALQSIQRNGESLPPPAC
ncbi:hypothetical protein THAOC_24140 [Thalassiosira oceanica]|uniref:Uncharacterized protein n=1 Tax=Thalassiosira oceanica TaxID=159749 RepID=K0S544_THAOC|nr:hypothetical protein THAOC_24140 [Thalassiosira oceanica]|eukprot:EJK56046.1 hypothetical protein THAOC_24140 [Thalassiosira oceanica]